VLESRGMQLIEEDLITHAFNLQINGTSEWLVTSCLRALVARHEELWTQELILSFKSNIRVLPTTWSPKR
jgi:hypothetical protein